MEKQIKLMLVEDEAMTALYIKMMLEKRGYLVSIFSTGEKAVDSAKAEPPDLIIMDIHLAGEIDGIEAARRIIKDAYIPIIFATGYQEKTYVDSDKSIKPLAYVTKPIDINKIISIITDYFKKKCN